MSVSNIVMSVAAPPQEGLPEVIISVCTTAGGIVLGYAIIYLVFYLNSRYKKHKAKKLPLEEIDPKDLAVETPNAATMGEVASGATPWQKLGKMWVHSPSMSVHKCKPETHAILQFDRNAAVSCPADCGSHGLRPFKKGTKKVKGKFFFVNVAVICAVATCLPCTDGARIMQPELVLTQTSVNSVVYQANETIDIPQLDARVYTDTEVEVSFCRSKVFLKPNIGCGDNTTYIGKTAAFVMDGCDVSMYATWPLNYRRGQKDFTSSQVGLRVCGAIMAEVREEGGVFKAIMMNEDVIVNEVNGYPLNGVAPSGRKRKAISIGTSVITCYGTGIGVTVSACPVPDYSGAINNLFDRLKDTVQELKTLTVLSANTDDHLFKLAANITARALIQDYASAEAAVLDLLTTADLNYRTIYQARWSKRNNIIKRRLDIDNMERDMLITAAGSPSRLLVDFAAAVAREGGVASQLMLGSGLCERGGIYRRTETQFEYHFRVRCPVSHLIQNVTVEQKPEYCVRKTDGKCYCQQFAGSIRISGQKAPLTGALEYVHRTWPFSPRKLDGPLIWSKTTDTVPQSGVLLKDETRETLGSSCPSIAVMKSTRGAVVHCGPTCTVLSSGKQYTDQIFFLPLVKAETVTSGSGTVVLEKLEKVHDVVVSIISAEGQAAALSTVSAVVVDTNSYSYSEMTAETTKANQDLVNGILETNQKFQDRYDAAVASQEALLRRIQADQDEFNDSGLGWDLGIGFSLGLGSIALVIGVVLVIVVCCCIKKQTTLGNRGDASMIWIEPPMANSQTVTLGLYFRFDFYLDAEEHYRLSRAVLILSKPIPRRLNPILMIAVQGDTVTRAALAKKNEETQSDEEEDESDSGGELLTPESIEMHEIPNALTLGGKVNKTATFIPKPGMRASARVGPAPDCIMVQGTCGAKYGVFEKDGRLRLDGGYFNAEDSKSIKFGADPWYNREERSVRTADKRTFFMEERNLYPALG